jgi:hypothetical protein
MGVIRFIRAVLGGLVALGLLAAVGVALLFVLPDGQAATAPRTFSQRIAPVAHPIQTLQAAISDVACSKAAAFEPAAAANAASLTTASVSPFGVVETGWAVYAPLIAREVGTGCAPGTQSFAAALSRWQGAHALAPSGRVDQATLSAMGVVWLLRRPFVRAMTTGCPAAPDEQTLARAATAEAYGGKMVLARPAALDAYRRMVAAARAETGARPPILTIASAYRGPAEEAARCADGGCGNPAKARCSAHRTGLALDLYLDDKPGLYANPGRAFSTADADRLRLSRTPAYLWLVRNADRFGFVPYPFEPWHWEWTGEPV